MSSVSCSADTPVREKPQPGMAKATPNRIFAAIIRSSAVLVAVLQEIFDESAYQRFLERSRVQSSAKAYAMFQQETEHAKSRRPRCC
ncbi:MAG: hypothetical protein WAJ97_03630 [Terriglobales bacterium]|jgi:hypothetical protein